MTPSKASFPFIASIFFSAAVHAATVPATEDTSSGRAKITLASNAATTLAVDSAHRAFIYFDLVGQLPAGAQIRYARLRLYFPRVTRAGSGLTIHKVTGNWGESLAGAEPAFEGTPIANLLPTDMGSKRFASVDVTAAVQVWIATPSSNEGFAVVSVSGASATLTASVTLGAKEGAGTGYPAELDIEIADASIAPGSIGTAEIATGAVGSAQIATGAVGSGQIALGAVGNVQLASGAVGSSHIAQGAIGNAQLGTNLTLAGTTNGAFNGSFSGNLNGNASGFSGNLAGDVTGTQGSTAVNSVGGVSAANLAAGATLANAATSAATPNAIVKRDANGSFAIGLLTVSGGFNLPVTTGSAAGVVTQGGNSLLHTFGTKNFFAGGGTGNFILSGSANTAVGFNALPVNTSGFANTAIGAEALKSNTTGKENSAFGERALALNTIGVNNTAFGRGALQDNTEANNNTAIGVSAIRGNTTGYNNTAIGVFALVNSETGFSNVATGANALFENISGDGNVAVGESALRANTTGSNNVASGNAALLNNATGHNNVAIGHDALLSNTAGNNSIAIGISAGSALTDGSDNIAIGNSGVTGESNTIRIGTQGPQARAFIAGIRAVTTGTNNAIPVMIDGNGQLGTASSSRRYKEDIADMGEVSARLRQLRPVTFRYKAPFADGGRPVQFGLIAEEVAAVFPELAVMNGRGEPETVKYQDLVPLLLNEMQKLDAEKDTLKKETADMRARLERLEAILNASKN